MVPTRQCSTVEEPFRCVQDDDFIDEALQLRDDPGRSDRNCGYDTDRLRFDDRVERSIERRPCRNTVVDKNHCLPFQRRKGPSATIPFDSPVDFALLTEQFFIHLRFCHVVLPNHIGIHMNIASFSHGPHGQFGI